MKQTKGFTLLELLISSSILVVLMSSAWFSFSAVRRAANMSNDSYSFFINSTIVTKEIQKLLQEASPYIQQGKDTFFKGTSSTLSLTSTHSESRFKPQQFVEIAMNASKLTITSKELDWLLRKKDNSPELKKRIFPGITDISFKYGDGKDEHWKEEWDGEKKGLLPDYIDIEFIFKSSNGQLMTYKQLIKLKLMKDSNLR
jgi:prepilin-type N-terminal cleavage/methylation domain-containing protein